MVCWVNLSQILGEVEWIKLTVVSINSSRELFRIALIVCVCVCFYRTRIVKLGTFVHPNNEKGSFRFSG